MTKPPPPLPAPAPGRAPAPDRPPTAARLSPPASERRAAAALAPPATEPDPVAHPHPRLRARRIAVRRAEGRRRLVAVLVVAAVVGLATLAWAAIQSPLLSVASIDVRGARSTDAVAVRRAAGIEGDALLTVDLGDVARRVETLPWVASAHATRRWPRTLRVEIVERVPAAALYQSDGTWSVVDGQGRVLATASGQPAGLVPVVAGGPAVPVGATVSGWAAQAVEVASRLAPGLQARLQQVTLDPSGGVVVNLTDGAVWLGDGSDLATKQLDALAVIGTLGAEPVGIVDVRVPGAPTRRPPPGDTTASPATAPSLATGGRVGPPAPLTGGDG